MRHGDGGLESNGTSTSHHPAPSSGQPTVWQWLQDPPLPLPASRAGWPQQEGFHARPVLCGWRAWCASQQGLCPASWGSGPAPVQPSALPPLPKCERRKGRPACLSLAALFALGGALLTAPWRSSLIQSQHNGGQGGAIDPAGQAEPGLSRY